MIEGHPFIKGAVWFVPGKVYHCIRCVIEHKGEASIQAVVVLDPAPEEIIIEGSFKI